MRHYPAAIESQIMHRIGIIHPDINLVAVCVDNEKSIDFNSLMLIIFLEDNSEYHEIARIAKDLVLNKHCAGLNEVVFVSMEALDKYKQTTDQIARFHLRDDILQGKLAANILHVVQDNLYVYTDGEEKCNSCFHDASNTKPLSLQNFSLLEEWFLDVPVDIRIFLSKFLNRDSYHRSNDKDAFLMAKLERLYGIYDSLLNTYNKKFSGVLQQATTDELAMHYHSISTVFAITSSTGISTSYKTAEKKIKEKATDELCYYNTYLKRYPLFYISISGEAEYHINLRECHLILMMDNLVRLTFRADPNPGENRTGQVCTLPITLQGLPMNCNVTLKWHKDDCQRDETCHCKKKTILQQSDFDLVLVAPTDSERDCWNRFQKLMTWGNSELWKKIQTTDLISMNMMDAHNEEDHDDEMDDILEPWEDQEDVFLAGLLEETNDNYVAVPLEDGLEGPLLDEIEVEKDETETLDSLLQTAQLVFQTRELLSCEGDISGIYHLEENHNIELEESFSQMNIETTVDESSSLQLEQTSTTEYSENSRLKAFGFEKFDVPPLLCRHPPPATGRDDDYFKLKEILDDVLVKTGRLNKNVENTDRILFGPDNKIGANLLQLIANEKKYQQFLPEFPLLHLRKSKINTLFSAYKDAGLLHLLMYMCDEEKKEWAKLLSMDHIDVATKYVRRLALSLHVAFVCRFLQCIDDADANTILHDLENGNEVESSKKWNDRFEEFLKSGCGNNATFALHFEMMQHCDEVVAVYLAERLGGNDGYDLLLAAVKSSLLFSFLNGATSYGPFCAKLLIQHYEAGHFHQCMKKALYSTPIGNSTINFACDSKREMDHQDALRGFRSGSNLSTVTSRMALIDSLNETHQRRIEDRGRSHEFKNDTQQDLKWVLTDVDLNHIIPTAKLIIGRGRLGKEENEMPENVYSSKKSYLTFCILDKMSFDVGKFLVRRFLANNELMGMSSRSLPDIKDFVGPPTLLNKAKKTKGVTLKRATEKTTMTAKTEREQKEATRKMKLRKEIMMADLLSSEMNMCQSLVKPDCSKPKVMKSKGIQIAMSWLLDEIKCSNQKLIQLECKNLPKEVAMTTKAATVEFAGVKFKTNVCSGGQYIAYVQNAVIKNVLAQIPNINRVVVCEEKYSFTPDNFKAATHEQRKTTKKMTIAHLRKPDEVVNRSTFKKDDIITTREGKSFISQYLAAKAKDLHIEANVTLDIDSEFNLHEDECDHGDNCHCSLYSVPLRCTFQKCQPNPTIETLNILKQKKGEAEMAQIDWLNNIKLDLQAGQSVCSILTSGDIDSIPLHLYYLPDQWPKQNGKFKHPVYVILQKPKKRMDVYDVTQITEEIEKHYNNQQDIVKKIAIILCMGGNDFIPKFHGLSHKKMLQLFLSDQHFLDNLFTATTEGCFKIDKSTYQEFVKTLFCPRSVDAKKCSFDEIRRRTIFMKNTKTEDEQQSLRNPKLWLPPASALERMVDLINMQIKYIQMLGDSMANLPDFLGSDCLKLTTTGEVEYYFGPDAKENIDHLKGQQKRTQKDTPQKGRRKKRQLTSTPSKSKP